MQVQWTDVSHGTYQHITDDTASGVVALPWIMDEPRQQEQLTEV
jgi:hypothetical protein